MTQHPWNQLISRLPEPHFLQTHEWGGLKSAYGWEPVYLIWDESGNMREERGGRDTFSSARAACMILKRSVSLFRGIFKANILYAPKGPLLDWNDQSLRARVLDDLQAFARREGAIFLKIDPDVELGRGIPQSEGEIRNANGQAVMEDLKRRGWGYSAGQIQFKNTVLIPLDSTEDELLARMKPKTRYNVRLAYKKGVSLRMGKVDDLPGLYKMYAETSVRDGFVIRDEEYYMQAWKLFMQGGDPSAMPLIAEVDGEPVAAIFLFIFGKRAYYVYGMSRAAHREKMPTYLLQWEAMKLAKSRGCAVYDLWGAPDVFDESDPMSGVFRFKQGLGGVVIRTLGAYDFAPSKFLYSLYTVVMPRILDVMRRQGRRRISQSLD